MVMVNGDDTVQRGSGAEDKPDFNARELRQHVDFREIEVDNLQHVPAGVRESLGNLIDDAVSMAASSRAPSSNSCV